jgi:insulin-like growth factor-binding protein complex acid labile subunit
MFTFLWVLTTIVTISNQECTVRQPTICCTNTSPETFLYDFLRIRSSVDEFFRHYNLEITNSHFVHIHSFLAPLPANFTLKKFALTNSLVEFIENGAFENFIFTSVLVLSNNKLSDISFVESLPTKLQKLYLDRNEFKVVTNVFSHLTELTYLDLSSCRISNIDPNSFSGFYNYISINVSNNQITSFDVLFRDGLRLQLDLSFNNIKYINCNDREVYFRGLNASYNKIESVVGTRCQGCGYYTREVTNFIDLSFNDLSNATYLSNLNTFTVWNLNLANSHIDMNFNFEILRLTKGILDLSNNNLKRVRPAMFGNKIEFDSLIMSNASISIVHENAFNNFGMLESGTFHILNISANPITELRNYTFNYCKIRMVDLSRCSIQKIQDNAFSGLIVTNTLNLSNNNITYINKNVFRNLTEVEIIDLSFNILKKLDNNLFVNCAGLRFLDLSSSKIEVIRSRTFAGTNSLSELYLQNNFLNRIDFQSVNLLGVVNLQNNAISDLEFSFFYSLSARTLLLTGNRIGSLLNNSAILKSYVKEIDSSRSSINSIETNAFQGLVNLEILNLSHNFIENILAGTFVPLKKLLQLDLTGNKMVSFSGEAFAFGNQLNKLGLTFSSTDLTSDTFVSLNYLKVLNVSNSNLTTLQENCFRGLIYLDNLNLQNVTISKITPGAFNGLESLESVDPHPLFKKLKTLKLGIFMGLSKLHALDLSRLEISSVGSGSFIGLKNLDKLLLSDNKIKKIVNNTFKGLHSLKTLNLSTNQISTLEADAFLGLTSLLELSLKDNNLTKLVLGTFQNFPQLQIMNLSKNNINKLLTGTFSNLKSLIALDFSYNNITKLEIHDIMSLSNLRNLDLTENHLIQMDYLNLIKSLRKLDFIGINGNKWKCDNLVSMLVAFQNYSVNWMSTESVTFLDENIDGIKCIDICNFFYCV